MVKTTLVVCLFLLLSAFCCTRAEAAISIVRTSAPFFPFDKDTSPRLNAQYVSFSVTTTSDIADAWAKIDNFTGGYLSVASTAPGADLYHIGPMTAGSTKTVFFYIETSANNDVTATQGHDISVWSGNPSTGGGELSRSRFTLTGTTVAGTYYEAMYDTIQAQASKVSSVVSGPTPAQLGGIVTITVIGDTGTSNGPMIFSPASDPYWPDQTYRLVSATITLPDGTVLKDKLYQGSYTGGSGAYVGVYTFVAVSSYSAPTSTSPVAYINSGNVLKHVPTGAGTIDPLAPPVSGTSGNSVIVTASCNPSMLPAGSAGDVACTINLINSGDYDVTLDDIDMILPVSPGTVTYNSGTSAYGGSAIANPLQSGRLLTWSGQYLVPAAGTKSLTLSLHVPDISGVYNFAAYAHIGAEQIDASAALGDDAKASCSVIVPTKTFLSKTFDPVIIGPGGTTAVKFTMTNLSGNAALSGLAFTEQLPAGLTWSGTPIVSQCGGTVAYAQSGGLNNTIRFTGGGLPAGPSSCTVTAQVTSTVPGSYSNTEANIVSLSGLDASGLSATLQVVPAVLKKSFIPSGIITSGTTELHFTITNAAGNPQQSGLSFTDTLPADLKWSGTPVASQCGGTLSYGGAANNVITFNGGTLAAGQSGCSVSATVTSTKIGSYLNDAPNISGLSASLTNGVTPQTLVVDSAPTLSKAFSPSAIPVGGTATLTFTIASSSQSATSPDFIDVFPLNLSLASPTIVNTSTNPGCVAASIYKPGTLVPSSTGDTSIEFSAAKIPANATCTYAVQVTSSIPGTYVNNAKSIIYIASLNNAVSDATLRVLAAPTVQKSFTPDTIYLGSSSTVTITLTNPNVSDISGLALLDSYPSGMFNVGGSGGTTCGGTIAAPNGGSTLSLSGGTIPARGSCTVTATVSTTGTGSFSNSSGPVTTASAGTGSAASATLTVKPLPNLTILKSAQVFSDPVNGSVSPRAIPGAQVLYQVTVTNFGKGIADADSIVITDAIPPSTSLLVSGTPVLFSEGSVPSGLTLNWGGLGSLTDDVKFSRDGGSTFNYIPVPAANGADPAVTHLRLTPRGIINPSNGSSNPTFSIMFKVIIN
ncbi:hypothetical protein LPW11_06695 [Geomonas sp. RF6]|uniref:DUF7933 domain-containing protein n=1 Tax=Geomonas sp. RF6 TaxID=2897342 RepID=UPI001E650235|nr:hypothetical protein [Geomonas sp. RF6]UFS71876.1 hypothetical protein LPW11_06695 [Geomonas sp. RF6]